MFGEEDEIECDYDDDYLMLAAPSPSTLSREERRAQQSGRVRQDLRTFGYRKYTFHSYLCKCLKTRIRKYYFYTIYEASG